MSANGDWRVTFRPDIPSPARMYNYFLGGKDNYPADREAAEEVLAVAPDARLFALANRAFLRRAVRYLAAGGMRQFVDIGAGLPARENVHEVAQGVTPEARVVYVDNDPVVLTHGRTLLHGVANTAIIPADLRQPESILAHDDLRKLIDFGQPTAVLLVAVLHFIPDDDDPAGLIRRLFTGLAAGSCLILSHGTIDSRPETANALKVYDRATSRAYARSRDQVQSLVTDLEIMDPGLVWAPEWRPDLDGQVDEDPGRSHVYALVARKPARDR